MRNLRKRIESLFDQRMRALVLKEFRQIRHDRRLAISLILPPLLQLTLFGFALSATVTNVRLGIMDESKTPESRELIAVLTESRSFRMAGYFSSVNQLGDAVSQGKIDAGVVIPYDYTRDLRRGRPATISRGYAEGVIESYTAGLRGQGIRASIQQIEAGDVSRRGSVQLTSAFLYNPGLVDSWFIATGVFGLLLMLNSSLISAAAMTREKE